MNSFELSKNPAGAGLVLARNQLPLAAMHQAGAVLVFAAALNVAHALR